MRKEIEKGNTLIDTKGNFVPEQKVDALLQKSYIAGLKDGSININTPFDNYKENEIAKCYTSADIALETITTLVHGYEETLPDLTPVEAECID